MYPNAKTFMLTIVALSLLLCGLSWADESDLVWSTFLGGSDYDYGLGIAVDSSGNVFVTGYTYSVDFPTTAGAFDTTLGGTTTDAFVIKFNPGGSALVYSTFLGGSSIDKGEGIVVDDSGNAYLTGSTYSNDFPTTQGALDTSYNGSVDIFVSKLNPTGSVLVYSTYLGSSNTEEGYDIALDCYGNVYVTGYTRSSGFPTTAGAFDETHDGDRDVFVTRLNSTGSALAYSTFIGHNADEVAYGIALDYSRNAYVTGWTTSYYFPTTHGAFDTTFNGDRDAFVVKLNPTGSALAYGTFLGGTGWEEGEGVAVDDFYDTYITGWTWSSDFPTTAEAFDTTHGGGDDVFVVKLIADGGTISYSTFLGGSEWDVGYDIAVDDSGYAYLTGGTYSPEFPTTPGAFDTTYNGDWDIFMVKLNTTGNVLCYATFLGGSSHDEGHDIALGDSHHVYVTGYTESADFPATAGAYDTTYNGYHDALVAKLDIRGGDLTPPEAIDDLIAELIARLDKNGKSFWGHICLSWTEPYDSAGVDHYVIYRSTNPLLLGDSLAMTTNTTYTDTGAVGNPIINYYYTVKAVDVAGNKSPSSNMVGEFDRPWSPAE